MLRKPIPLVISLFLLVFSVPVVFAGTQTVTTTADNTTVDGSCSLREAITRANAGSSSADCPNITAAPNTIILPAGDYTLTSGTQLSVSSAIIIESGGGTVNIEANAAANTANYRIFFVSGSLTLDGVTVRNGGNLTTFNQGGGCIFASGSLILQDGTVVEDCNTMGDGGAIDGGNPWNLTITGSTIQNNTAFGNGGGYPRGWQQPANFQLIFHREYRICHY